MENTLIKVSNISKHFPLSKREYLTAVNEVSLDIKQGDIIGVVGESGCGKTTLGKLVLNLETADEGDVFYKDTLISDLNFKKMKPYRKYMQMIFQNTGDAFDPYMSVRQILRESIDNFNMGKDIDVEKTLVSIMEDVGLSEEHLNRYPEELSGGQRQRVGIARALVTNPEFIVCDEAVSNLDYSIRNKVLDLLIKLREDRNLTYMFISHDITAVNYICQKVIVMYAGTIMEIIPNLKNEDDIKHPYTKALIAAKLRADPYDRRANRILFLTEEKPQGTGCPFYSRCLEGTEKCSDCAPELKSIGENHYTACHYH